MPEFITKSAVLDDGLCVWFGNDMTDEAYYAHAMSSLGDPSSPDAGITVWGWVNHMRHKVWFTTELEVEFWKEVSKHFKV